MFSLADFVRAFVLFCVFEGFFYLLFPSLVKRLSTEIIVETDPFFLRLYGVFLILLGWIITWQVFF
ncbi:MAG: DUF2065 domain-containing protein [Alphaproteobacteria bacterium]|nr:DUF2065 family protein [Alphaproteobacteria bacterium]NCB49819.1 DUF2065 domain-containing protein [Alphaproteobacteria bacterium]